MSREEELLEAIERIRRLASGEDEVIDGQDANDALIQIDNICKQVKYGCINEPCDWH